MAIAILMTLCAFIGLIILLSPIRKNNALQTVDQKTQDTRKPDLLSSATASRQVLVSPKEPKPSPVPLPESSVLSRG